MGNSYFRFKQFTVRQDRCGMRVTTDSVLHGARMARMEKGITRMDREGWRPSLRLLDIGTGTGVLSLMAAQELPYRITAVELDAAAAAQASENFSASPWSDRLAIWQGDILDYPETDPFDVIVCNPPFYEGDLRGPKAARNAAHHDTTLLWKDLFPKIARLLKPGGRCHLLLPYRRKAEALALLPQHHHRLITDVYPVEGKPPTRTLLTITDDTDGRADNTDGWERIIIKDREQNYTQEFIELMKPYYLHL